MSDAISSYLKLSLAALCVVFAVMSAAGLFIFGLLIFWQCAEAFLVALGSLLS